MLSCRPANREKALTELEARLKETMAIHTMHQAKKQSAFHWTFRKQFYAKLNIQQKYLKFKKSNKNKIKCWKDWIEKKW